MLANCCNAHYYFGVTESVSGGDSETMYTAGGPQTDALPAGVQRVRPIEREKDRDRKKENT